MIDTLARREGWESADAVGHQIKFAPDDARI
jgi:hypothetical protein